MKAGYVVLFFTIVICFATTIFNGYNLDDELVTKNHSMSSAKSAQPFSSIFTTAYHSEFGINYGYRPISIASFYLEHRIFGESPWISHSINLVLYLLLVLLLFKLLSLLFVGFDPFILLFISLLFAIHPIHSEVVASIKNRDEILSFLFLGLALLCAFGWINKKHWYHLFLIVVFASLSILSKKSSIPILFIFPLILAYKYGLSKRHWITLSLSFSIPLAFFAFNLNPTKGVFLFIAIYLAYYAAFHFINVVRIHRSQKHWPLMVLPIFVALFCGLGAYHQSFVLFLSGAALLIPLLFIEFDKTAIALLVILTIGFVLFQKQLFFMLALFILSAHVFIQQHKFTFKAQKLIYFILVLLAVAVYLQKIELVLIYLSPLILLSCTFIHRYLPISLALLSISIGALFFAVTAFHLGLTLLALIPFFRHHLILSKKVLLSIFVGLSVLVSIGQEDRNSFFLNQAPLHKQTAENNLLPTEGRKLEFVENSLVEKHGLDERMATGTLVLGEYLALLCFPSELSFYYGYAKMHTVDFSLLKVWLSLISYLALLLISIYFLNKNPLISIGLIWYLIAILAFSNWGDLVAGMMAERLAFIASFGFCIFVGGLLQLIKIKKVNLFNKSTFKLFCLSLLLLLFVKSVFRNALWDSSVKLMKHDIQHLGNSSQANYLLAIHSIKETLNSQQSKETIEEQVGFSIEHFKKAISIYPYYFNYHFDLGRAYLSIEEIEQAKQAFLLAHKLRPSAKVALYELSLASFRMEEFEESLKYSLALLEVDESNSIVYEIAAFSAYYLNRYDDAIKLIEKGLLYFPQNIRLMELKLEIGN